VIDLAKLELSAQVEEIDRMNMKTGQTVEITLDALREKNSRAKCERSAGQRRACFGTTTRNTSSM